MSLNTIKIDPLDPNLFTGPTRMMAGIMGAYPVTPGVPYGQFARWLFIGGAGSLSVVNWDGTTALLTNFAPGVWQPQGSIMINSSGTTATGILYGI